MDETAWLAFTRLRYEHPEEALQQIAELVRQGCNDPTFLRLLADHIDPQVKRTALGTKFRLHRTTGKKSPPAVPNYDLREFLETHIDIFKDFQGLCCTNPFWDSSHESSVVAGIHEQTHTSNLQDQELAILQ